jgi:hypothetical protein
MRMSVLVMHSSFEMDSLSREGSDTQGCVSCVYGFSTDGRLCLKLALFADKILSMMGEGTFGRVLECWDRKTKVTVAVKVIRSVPKYREAAMIEVCRSPTHRSSFLLFKKQRKSQDSLCASM